MRRDPTTPSGSHPYDLEAADDADITQQFWGTTRGWTPRSGSSGQHPTVAADAGDDALWADRTGPIRAIRGGLADLKPRRSDPAWLRTGTIERTRAHGIARPRIDDAASHRAEATLGDLARGDAAMELMWDDDGTPPTMQTSRISRTQPAIPEPTRATRRNDAIRRAQTPGPAASVRRHGDARPISPTRSHDVVHDDLDAIDLDTGGVDLDGEIWHSPVAPLVERLGLGAVDPLLLRLGMIILTGVLALPFALASRDTDAGTVAVTDVAAAGLTLQAGPAPSTPATVPAPQLSVADASAAAPPADDGDAGSSAAAVSSDPSSDVTAAADVTVSSPASEQADTALAVTAATEPAVTAVAEVAVADEPADRVEPDCSRSYEAGPGDSWYRIADGAGISPQELLDANVANLDTVIFPGDEICLPEGADTPTPPTTSVPATAPATTAPAATTQAPATTAAPATTVPPPAPVSTAEVQRLIREIWPDELEEKALQIAWRESNYRAGAWNGGCCYGVFQIHWTSHRSWLDDYGIVVTNDLLDARKNITAAFALYQRAGGWGPWGG